MNFLILFNNSYQDWWDRYKDTMRYVDWLETFYEGRLRYDSGQLNIENNKFLFTNPLNLMAFLLRYS